MERCADFICNLRDIGQLRLKEGSGKGGELAADFGQVGQRAAERPEVARACITGRCFRDEPLEIAHSIKELAEALGPFGMVEEDCDRLLPLFDL